jgi:HlyD family secretion protein
VQIAQANLAVAEATLADAESRLADLQNGPDPDQLAAAQARLAAAQASLAAAQDALKNSELRAPFGGVVADLKIKVGEQIAAGQAAAVLADFSGWVVETDNLTEIEVVKVAEGQPASIVLDALPEVTLHGTVTAISPVFEEKRGDITYTVTIALTDGDPSMRWGMTAVSTFEK